MRTARISAILALWMLALTPALTRRRPRRHRRPRHPLQHRCHLRAAGRTPGHHAAAHITPRPRQRSPAPRRDPVMERVLGRALSVDEAVAIALETQPAIQARLGRLRGRRLARGSGLLAPAPAAQRQSSRPHGARRAEHPTAGSVRSADERQHPTSIRPFGETLTATVTALAAPLRLRQDVRVHRGGPKPGRGALRKTSSCSAS